MWPKPGPVRRKCLARWIDHRLNAAPIIHLPRNENIQLVGEADEPSVEHPMQSTTKGYAILHAIRATFLDWPDMGCFGFSPSPAIDKLPPGDGAAAVIGSENSAPEQLIAFWTRLKRLNDFALDLERDTVLLQSIIKRLANPRQEVRFFWQAKRRYPAKISSREVAYRPLPASSESTLVALAVRPIQWDRDNEIEVRRWLNLGNIHVAQCWIRNNSRDLSDCEIASRLGHFGRFVIDDPVTLYLLGAFKIELG